MQIFVLRFRAKRFHCSSFPGDEQLNLAAAASRRSRSAVPSGLVGIYSTNDSRVENLGYSRMSLRDMVVQRLAATQVAPNFFFASAGTSILVEPTSLISTMVVRSMSRSSP